MNTVTSMTYMEPETKWLQPKDILPRLHCQHCSHWARWVAGSGIGTCTGLQKGDVALHDGGDEFYTGEGWGCIRWRRNDSDTDSLVEVVVGGVDTGEPVAGA